VWRTAAAVAIAAALAIAAAGAAFSIGPWRTHVSERPPESIAQHHEPAAAEVSAQRALWRLGADHLERSKLVVLDLAMRDPRTSPAEWQDERRLAASLLSDTRLYRLTAEQKGMPDLAGVMGDLETVLLEASMSDTGDPAALSRVQHLISRRDLLVKMQVVASAAGS
ncbi:MAG: hypothetical protein ACRD1V_08650, partial [Vicinamibacterales bacterium]